MKILKTSAVALAVSALLAGPVLAQGTPSDMKTRGTVQGGAMAPAGAGADLNAPAGKAGSKGTVGSASGGVARAKAGAPTPSGGVDGSGDAAGSKR